MAGFGRCKRHDDPELDCRVCIEAETVAAIVAWARLNWRAYDATSKMLDAIERGEWHKERS